MIYAYLYVHQAPWSRTLGQEKGTNMCLQRKMGRLRTCGVLPDDNLELDGEQQR